MQPGPWLRPATTYSPNRIRSTHQRDQATEQPNRNKQQTNKETNQPPKERGAREEVRVAGVCVYCRGRQSSAILSHLSKLTRGDACKSKTQDRENRQRQTARKSTQHTKPNKKGRPGHQEGEEATNTNQDKRQRGGQPNQTRKGARGEESRRRPAGKEREDAREGSRGRREKTAQTKKAGACSFSGVLRGFWITQGRIPQCRSERHMNNTHNMV